MILELLEDTFWFWNAPEDFHGTSMCALTLKHPDNYQSYAKSHPKKAQWARVMTMPHRVVAAHQRH
jgi:hypothetical protein